jgi:hypothetical protein
MSGSASTPEAVEVGTEEVSSSSRRRAAARERLMPCTLVAQVGILRRGSSRVRHDVELREVALVEVDQAT